MLMKNNTVSIWVFVCVAAVSITFAAAADSNLTDLSQKQDEVVVVAFGDSITLASRQIQAEKWASILEEKLNAACERKNIKVVNSGVGGNTSREGLARIKKDVLSHTPDVVLVEFGGNDATQTKSRHVTLDEFRQNLAKICSLVQDNQKTRVVLLTFPPVVDEWHSWGKDPFFIANGGGDRYVENYRKVTREYAAAHDLLLIDIDKALRAEIGRTSREAVILRDGVHLTTEGNRVVATAIAEALLRAF